MAAIAKIEGSAGGTRPLAALAILLATACGDATGPAHTPEPTAATAEKAALVLDLSRDTLRAGDTLTVRVRDARGAILPNAVLSTSDPRVLVADAASRVVATGEGRVVLRATAAGLTTERHVVVIGGGSTVPVSLSVLPRAATLLPGAELQLALSAAGAGGQQVAAAGVTFRSSDSTVAAVSASGRVHALRPGAAEIAVSLGTLIVRVPIQVQVPRVSELTISLNTAGVPAAGQSVLHPALTAAAGRWQRVIMGDLPDVTVAIPAGTCGFGTPAVAEHVDDVLIIVRVEALDGPGGVMASGGACISRQGSMLPVVGVVRIDEADLQRLHSLALLEDVLAHEIGHVLGIGTLWHQPGERALVNTTTGYTGPGGRAGAADLGVIVVGAAAVPVEQLGGAGTRAMHWGGALSGELMTGWLDGGNAPITAATVGALRDLGYDVLAGAAEPLGSPAGARYVSASAPTHITHGAPAAPRLVMDVHGVVTPLP